MRKSSAPPVDESEIVARVPTNNQPRRHLFSKRHHQYVAENGHIINNHHDHANPTHHNHHNHQYNHHVRPNESSSRHHQQQQQRSRQSRSADVVNSTKPGSSRHVSAEKSSRHVKSAGVGKSANNHHRLKTSDFITRLPNNGGAKVRKRSSTESSSIEA